MADRPDPVMDLERKLAALASATAGIDADPRIGEAIVSSLELRKGSTSGAPDDLARLAEATASLEPSDAFSDEVAQQLTQRVAQRGAQRVDAAAKPTALDAVSRTGPIAAAVAAFAAAAALLLSFQTQREVDAVIVTSVLSVEVGE